MRPSFHAVILGSGLLESKISEPSWWWFTEGDFLPADRCPDTGPLPVAHQLTTAF